MNILNSKYISKTKFILELIGLWPYHSSTRRWISLILYYVVIISGTTPMILHVVLKSPTFEDFGLCVTLALVVVGSQTKYLVSFLCVSQLRILLSQIKKDWKTITEKEELNILKKYAEESQLVSLLYIICELSAGLVCSGVPAVLSLIENLSPLKNGSHPMIVLTPMNYLFFEYSDHLIFTNFHIFFVCMCTVSVFAGIDTIYLCTVQHVAALFTIDCRRLENMFKSDDFNACMKNLKDSVELYNKCIRCCQLLEDYFSNCLFFVLIICPIGIGAIGYLILNTRDIFAISKFVTLLLGIFTNMFYLNWVGQKIIDSSETVFYSAYNSNWYDMPPKMQKSVIIIMCRSIKPQELTAGKMFILSMYSFGKLMRACSSLFAVFAAADQNFG